MAKIDKTGDTAIMPLHYDDGPHLDREWCIKETKDLLKQLQEL